MPLYIPVATMEPCTLSEAPQGWVFLPFGHAPMLVGEVDQHDIAVWLGGHTPFGVTAFSRDERSNVRGLAIGRAIFDADPESAYRARDSNYAAGDLITGKSCTSIVATHEDGTAFQVAILGDPQRGPEAGFTAWRLGVAGRGEAFVPVYERGKAVPPAANGNTR
ncbi:MAG: hypothetical protein JWL91_1607 [Sphingomonas bacterium]|jgi:hypothetical protein|nr:hypothetical protein [Sphingomonas bacterium]